jgi:amidase
MKRTQLGAAIALTLTLSFGATLAHAATLDIKTASIADFNAAYASGKVTSVKVVEAYLKRIEAFDKKGPTINSVIYLNPNAVKEAKALDAERKAGKVRGPLHGIPVLLKDNFDTFDMPTTAGSQLLEGSIPPDDAFVVKKLREAGAIILAKVNLSEFAGSGGSVSGAPEDIAKLGRVPNGSSSAGGQTRNPHDLERGPSGSSGGTGAAIAAAFGSFGLGTDTGGSVRGPSSANGIVGLKPTHGLMSRDGIVPLGLSFDTGGPMARSVYDIAVTLNAMTGIDPADDATLKSFGKFDADYTQYLKTGSLKGARIGIARDFLGRDAGTDKVVESAIVTLKKLGAEVIDPIKYPDYLLQYRQGIYNIVVSAEFKYDIGRYLNTLKPGFPKNLDEIVTLANDPKTGYRSPEKAVALKYTNSVALSIDDPQYIAAKNEALAASKSAVLAIFEKYKLDAILYPTSPTPASPIKPDPNAPPGGGGSATNIANQTGFPDLIVPAGMTDAGLPVTISFFGKAFTEGKLISYGYDFEQATKAIKLPKNTPALASDVITY